MDPAVPVPEASTSLHCAYLGATSLPHGLRSALGLSHPRPWQRSHTQRTEPDFSVDPGSAPRWGTSRYLRYLACQGAQDIAAVSILTQHDRPLLHWVWTVVSSGDAVGSLRAGTLCPSPSVTHRSHPSSLRASGAPCSLVDGDDEAWGRRAGGEGRGRREEGPPVTRGMAPAGPWPMPRGPTPRTGRHVRLPAIALNVLPGLSGSETNSSLLLAPQAPSPHGSCDRSQPTAPPSGLGQGALSSHQPGLLPQKHRPPLPQRPECQSNLPFASPTSLVKSSPFAFHLQTHSFQAPHKRKGGREKGGGEKCL